MFFLKKRFIFCFSWIKIVLIYPLFFELTGDRRSCIKGTVIGALPHPEGDLRLCDGVQAYFKYSLYVNLQKREKDNSQNSKR